MAIVNEKTMNKGKVLSIEQINRICITVAKVADNSNNAQMITLAHNLKMSKDIEEKRKWIVLFYISAFQLCSFINIARDKDLPIDEYIAELDKLFKGK